MQIKLCWGLIGLVLVCGPALAVGKSEIRDIILEAYPGAKITEIERETHKGQKVFEVDFQHGGETLEAILSLEGDFIKVGIDD
ncbi:MAG: PepSY domain-containing protein [Gammaproteobacteria bacterium]|nr:PepSY domain-containing protein [Gammaproteobacteria bacterium]